MAGPTVPGVDKAGIAPVRIGKGPAQPVFVGWHDDDVDMVRHQAITPDFRPGPLCGLRQKVAVKRVVGILEKRLLPTIAPLGDMIRKARNDEAWTTGRNLMMA